MAESSSAIHRYAIISVSEKEGLRSIAKWLIRSGLRLMASGGTTNALRRMGFEVKEVTELTEYPEMLDGRVKTLHPMIYCGILASNSVEDIAELNLMYMPLIEVVVVNLYAFKAAAECRGCTVESVIEKLDIGGVSLLRAGAKNYSRVLTISDPLEYEDLTETYDTLADVPDLVRKELALKAFALTSCYDLDIGDYFRKTFYEDKYQYDLRYGMNPHQTQAQIYTDHELPFNVLNGSPGYINLCDALNAWQLVNELKKTTGLPSAASFKHLSPAGAAVAVDLDAVEARVCMVHDLTWLSKIATAYARARGADRMSSFGDFIALSEPCDSSVAMLISREVSDGIIAPSYSPEALAILKKKKKGRYCILMMKNSYTPKLLEVKTIFGLTLEQARNTAEIAQSNLGKVVSKNTKITAEASLNLAVAAISVKYTQSNSICIAHRGQLVGVGCGQQSRIHCTRIAAEKAYKWRMRHHQSVLTLDFKKSVTRADVSNAIDNYVGGTVGIDMSDELFESYFNTKPEPLNKKDNDEWCSKVKELALASDAFFPFRDSIDRANWVGVRYVISPAGSNNDESVQNACDDHNMVLIHSENRMFHH